MVCFYECLYGLLSIEPGYPISDPQMHRCNRVSPSGIVIKPLPLKERDLPLALHAMVRANFL